jgi:outer membrane lipoprotein SlyB
MSENKNSIHPLVATAAGAVILASLVGVASMTGMLPSKNQAATVAASVPVVVDVAMAASVPAPVLTATPDEGSVEQKVTTAPTVVKPKPVVQVKPKPVVKDVEKVIVQHEEKVICSSCGTVESVTSREEKAEKGSGLGAVAGALLGGVVGNQVGGGNGRKFATVAGAIGGGMAGNEIEKRKNSTIHYEVRVRMDNGDIRTFKPTVEPQWRNGDKVKVVEGQLTFQ